LTPYANFAALRVNEPVWFTYRKALKAFAVPIP
jgi:hypothetical protein